MSTAKFRINSFILAAAGSALRFGSDKLTADLNGLPVFLHSVRTFYPVTETGRFVVAAAAEHLRSYRGLAARFLPDFSAIVWVEGGATRSESIAKALAALPPSSGLVAVHDAARPLAGVELLEALCRLADKCDGAIPGAPVIDSLKQVGSDGVIVNPVERSGVFAVATPQVFKLEKLRAAYSFGGEATDDAEIMRRSGLPVAVLNDTRPNLKLTRPEDLNYLRFLTRR